MQTEFQTLEIIPDDRYTTNSPFTVIARGTTKAMYELYLELPKEIVLDGKPATVGCKRLDNVNFITGQVAVKTLESDALELEKRINNGEPVSDADLDWLRKYRAQKYKRLSSYREQKCKE